MFMSLYSISTSSPFPSQNINLLLCTVTWIILGILFLYMGAGLATEKNTVTHPSNPNLCDLPESCIASILSCLEPSEICKLACLNKTFHQASLTDVVWASKLPENHEILWKKLFSEEESSENLSKKEIFSRLCRPIPFSGDTKEVWLENSSRGICVSISWKGLKITGIDDRRYWTHISTDESRFHTIAYLQQMWWLEVEGNLEFEFPAGNYSLFFRLQLGRATKRSGCRRIISDLKQVHGWNKPVQFQLASSNGQHVTSKCYLNEAAGKWMHYHVGDFVVENSYIPTKLKFSMAQIDCTHTKAGLCLDSVFIFPSETMNKLKQF